MDALWGLDPVHLSTAGYKTIAKSTLELVLAKLLFTNCSETKERDRASLRPGWIAGDRHVIAPQRGSCMGSLNRGGGQGWVTVHNRPRRGQPGHTWRGRGRARTRNCLLTK